MRVIQDELGDGADSEIEEYLAKIAAAKLPAEVAEKLKKETDRLAKVRKEVKNNKYAMDAIDFIENRSKRGIGTAKNAE